MLRLLSEHDSGATVTEIAERLELNRSTTTAIVTTLAQWGWVARRGQHVYTLGDGLLALAEAVRQRLPLLPLANAVLERLTAETGYRSTLSSADDDHITIIAACGERGRTTAGSGIGTRMPNRPPFGTVIAAWSSPATRCSTASSGTRRPA